MVQSGAIDRNGDLKIPLTFSLLRGFSSGRAGACSQGVARKCGYINLNGRWLIEPVYDEVFSEEIIALGGEVRFAQRVTDFLIEDGQLRGLTVQDVEDAIRRENVELPGGRIESAARELTVRTDTRMSSPDQFRQVVVARGAGGAQVLLGEVARIEIGAEDTRGGYRINGRPAIGLGIYRQSTANTLSVADGVKAELERLKPSLPPGVDTTIGYDESLFIAQSIYEVEHALMIALLLVVGVIFLFLRSVRATIIPAVAIPVSIVASFMAMAVIAALLRGFDRGDVAAGVDHHQLGAFGGCDEFIEETLHL